ncbi:MAG TPA: 5-(carboxyamino)imidazole ribonucleotide mutase [Nitrospiria bacterium]|nr:5-(carboxyamino)imidazole ribonucleotide mutase [Nitrospiria bacterium]
MKKSGGDGKTLVLIIMGSPNDLPVMEEAVWMLEKFGVSYEITVTSAHRSPDRTQQIVKSAEKQGTEVFIVGAGGAAHLAGVAASLTSRPVIGVPIDSSSLQGMDALLSTVQMPGGVPVASMAIGKAGAKNAGIFAVQILSGKYPDLSGKLLAYKAEMAKEVEEKAVKMKKPA